MKLNTKQSLFLIRYLSEKFEFDFLEHYALELGNLFNGDNTELRIIPKYGMAGKIWNNGHIYITGYSPVEIGEGEFKAQQIEINEINSEIKKIIDFWAWQIGSISQIDLMKYQIGEQCILTGDSVYFDFDSISEVANFWKSWPNLDDKTYSLYEYNSKNDEWDYLDQLT